MLTPRALRPRPLAHELRVVLLTASCALGAAAVLTGCDDRLPGFANPPPYDAGVASDAGEDEDAG